MLAVKISAFRPFSTKGRLTRVLFANARAVTAFGDFYVADFTVRAMVATASVVRGELI